MKVNVIFGQFLKIEIMSYEKTVTYLVIENKPPEANPFYFDLTVDVTFVAHK